MGPFDQLLTQPSGTNVHPETLEMLGRKASELFQTQGIPLNQALSQVLANHPELGNEHIKRIVEFANTVTFQELFQNGEDKNVHFDVADPGVILRDLKDGGSPAHDGKTLKGNQDYMRPPQQQLGGDNAGDLDAALMQQFTGSSPSPDNVKVAGAITRSEVVRGAKKNGKMLLGAAAVGGAAYAGARGAKRLIDGKEKKEKTASDLRDDLYVDHERHANPVEDAYDAQVRLQATRDSLVSSYENMDLLMKQAQEDFYQQVRLQVGDPEGAGLGGVLGALEKVAEPDILEVLMEPVAARLVKEGFSQAYLNKSLTKTAGVVPNLEHPLFAAADSILKLASEMLVCSKALDDVDNMLRQTNEVFKTAGALTTGVKKVIDHHGHVPAGIRQRFPRN